MQQSWDSPRPAADPEQGGADKPACNISGQGVDLVSVVAVDARPGNGIAGPAGTWTAYGLSHCYQCHPSYRPLHYFYLFLRCMFETAARCFGPTAGEEAGAIDKCRSSQPMQSNQGISLLRVARGVQKSLIESQARTKL